MFYNLISLSFSLCGENYIPVGISTVFQLTQHVLTCGENNHSRKGVQRIWPRNVKRLLRETFLDLFLRVSISIVFLLSNVHESTFFLHGCRLKYMHPNKLKCLISFQFYQFEFLFCVWESVNLSWLLTHGNPTS